MLCRYPSGATVSLSVPWLTYSIGAADFVSADAPRRGGPLDSNVEEPVPSGGTVYCWGVGAPEASRTTCIARVVRFTAGAKRNVLPDADTAARPMGQASSPNCHT